VTPSTTLSHRALNLLRHGDVDGDFDGDGSRVIASILLDAVNRDVRPEYVRQLLANPQHKGGFACLRRHRGDLDRWFAAEWKRAEAKGAASPPMGDRHEASMAAVMLAEQAEAMEWRGIAGATDFATYRRVLAIAAQAGRLGPLALAVRTLAEGIGVDRRTAGRSLSRLVDRGLLRRIAAGRGHAAATYQVEAGRPCPTVPPDAPAPQSPHRGADVPAPQSPVNDDEIEEGGRTPLPHSREITRTPLPHSGRTPLPHS
jgi:hypothetical protein